MKKVLFVCTGNTCRSCMAEAIANKILRNDKKDAEIIISSAGISAYTGDRASYQAIEVMQDYGIDLTGHTSTRVSKQLLDEADLILTMTDSHKRALLRIDNSLKDKVLTLGEYVDAQYNDVEDPFGQSVEVYKKCAEQLKRYITKALDKMSKMN